MTKFAAQLFAADPGHMDRINRLLQSKDSTPWGQMTLGVLTAFLVNHHIKPTEEQWEEASRLPDWLATESFMMKILLANGVKAEEVKKVIDETFGLQAAFGKGRESKP